MNKYVIKKKVYTGPGKFDELTRWQLIYWSNFLLKKVDWEKCKRRIAWRFTTIPTFLYFDRLSRISQLYVEDTFNYLLDTYEMQNWLFPSIRIRFKKYYGPAYRLKNITVAEFAMADMHFQNYLKSKSESDLNRFVACLFREKRTGKITDDVRTHFENYEVDGRATLFSKIPMKVKYAVLLNYIGVRALMVRKHPNVFKQHADMHTRSFGWAGIIEDMAGDKLGTIEKIETMFFWNLLFIIEKREVQRIEREQMKTETRCRQTKL